MVSVVSFKRDFDKSPITYTREHFMQNSKTNSPNSPNSASETPESGKQRQTPPVYRRVKRKVRARLTIRDAEDMAQLAAMRLTESESCAKLDIPVRTWRDWKARHNHEEIFTQIFERIKGERIAAHLKNIEKFSEKDWRASECYLEKTQPSRFASRALAFPESAATTVNVHNNFLFNLAAQTIYGGDAVKSLPAPTRKEPEALPERTPEAATANVAALLEVMPKDPRKP